MLSVSSSVKIFLYAQAADLRRGYDGLASIVQEAMGEDPLPGSLYLFVNKRGNRIKLFYWDRDGYAIWMKRLESGSFELPVRRSADSPSVKLTASELSLILEGMELSSVRRRRRFQLRPAGRPARADFPERGQRLTFTPGWNGRRDAEEQGL